MAALRDEGGLLPIPPDAPLTIVNTTEREAYAVLTRTRGIGPNQATPAFDVFAERIGANRDAAVISAEDFDAAALPAGGANRSSGRELYAAGHGF